MSGIADGTNDINLGTMPSTQLNHSVTRYSTQEIVILAFINGRLEKAKRLTKEIPVDYNG